MSFSGLNSYFIPARPSERLACLTVLVHQDDQQEEGEGVLPNSWPIGTTNKFTLLTTKRCPFDEPLSDVHFYESIPPGRNCWETKDCLFLHLPHTIAEDKHTLEPVNRVENVQIWIPFLEFLDQNFVAKLFIYQCIIYDLYDLFWSSYSTPSVFYLTRVRLSPCLVHPITNSICFLILDLTDLTLADEDAFSSWYCRCLCSKYC